MESKFDHGGRCGGIQAPLDHWYVLMFPQSQGAQPGKCQISLLGMKVCPVKPSCPLPLSLSMLNTHIFVLASTPLKTNMDPENHWFEKETSLSGCHCQRPC